MLRFIALFLPHTYTRAHTHNLQVPEAEKEGSVFAQLQGLFAQLALSKCTFAQPVRFWAAFKDYDGTPIDVREHQDAYEFFTRLQVCVCAFGSLSKIHIAVGHLCALWLRLMAVERAVIAAWSCKRRAL